MICRRTFRMLTKHRRRSSFVRRVVRRWLHLFQSPTKRRPQQTFANHTYLYHQGVTRRRRFFRVSSGSQTTPQKRRCDAYKLVLHSRSAFSRLWYVDRIFFRSVISCRENCSKFKRKRLRELVGIFGLYIVRLCVAFSWIKATLNPNLRSGNTG